jgi:hypothetical protein
VLLSTRARNHLHLVRSGAVRLALGAVAGDGRRGRAARARVYADRATRPGGLDSLDKRSRFAEIFDKVVKL